MKKLFIPCSLVILASVTCLVNCKNPMGYRYARGFVDAHGQIVKSDDGKALFVETRFTDIDEPDRKLHTQQVLIKPQKWAELQKAKTRPSDTFIPAYGEVRIDETATDEMFIEKDPNNY